MVERAEPHRGHVRPGAGDLRPLPGDPARRGKEPLETGTYTSVVLEDWLPDCQALRGISSLDELLYIVYDTNAGREVWLTYGAEGLTSQLVYEPDTDTLYQPITGEKTFNFRYGK